MEEFPMKTILCTALFALSPANAAAQFKTLTNDPLTGLPLISASEPRKGMGNEPDKMPDGQVCRSSMKGEFYMLSNIKTNEAAAWYASHLSGFKKVQGYESGRAQIVFSNSDGTILIVLTGDKGAQGENADAYSVAYERNQPGLSEKTVTGSAQGKIVCP
jgi:hypothetical protein